MPTPGVKSVFNPVARSRYFIAMVKVVAFILVSSHAPGVKSVLNPTAVYSIAIVNFSGQSPDLRVHLLVYIFTSYII
jgi:hypothetical protein